MPQSYEIFQRIGKNILQTSHINMGATSAPANMQAAQWDPKRNGVVVNSIPIPEPKPNQILVKMASASLCRSDILAIELPGREEPFTLGHEGAGFVRSIGSAVPRDKIDFDHGDAVGFLYINGSCFECAGCMIHNLHCEADGAQVVVAGFGGSFGFFAEYAAIDWQNVCLLPSTLDPRASSAIFCAGITAYHAVKSCDLQPGQTIGIIGAGGLGQLGIQYAKALGLLSVAIDIDDDVLESCIVQGATHTFNSMTNGDYVSQLKALTPGNRGLHAAVVFSDAPAAYASTPMLLRPGGLWMFIGLAKNPVGIDTTAFTGGAFRIAAESTGIPQRMKAAVDFTAENGIVPAVEIRPGHLHEVDGMVADMRAGKVKGRMGITLD